MRKFKLLTQDGYTHDLIKGKVYDENYLPAGNTVAHVKHIVKSFPHDWQEVTEEEIKLTEIDKIVLIDFLNDHFEDFIEFIDSSEETLFENYSGLDGFGSEVKISNLIDKIEKL